MMQGTTPYLLIRVKQRDLTGAQTIILTIRQGACPRDFGQGRISVLSVDESGTLLCVHLTQDETLALRPGAYEMQVSWIDAGGESRKTHIGTADVLRALHKGVIIP